MVMTRGKGGGGGGRVKGTGWWKETGLGQESTQYSVQMMCCTPETYVILLTNVTPVNSIKKKRILNVVMIES